MKAYQLIGVAMLLLFLAFGSGYFLGYHRARVVEKARMEAQARINSMESELKKTMVRMALVEVKERLGQARLDLMEKGYGEAGHQIEAARKVLAMANERADEEMKKTLGLLTKLLIEVKADIDRLDPNALAKIDVLRGRINEVAAR